VTGPRAQIFVNFAATFDKFGTGTTDANRRLQLANSAIRSGAVTVSDLRGQEPT
jgi:hypothetical protein